NESLRAISNENFKSASHRAFCTVKDIKKCTARVKAVHFFIFSFHGHRLEHLAQTPRLKA
ncbi:hypothetical protein O3649_07755, partial [Rothia sp. 27098_8_29]|uniref:hypothetical protein n=1 Tax=Rothia sp. 27098_8_29 TaxID=3003676 RepID=UPI00352C4EE9